MSAEEAIWHDVECGGYEVDISVWIDLGSRHGGPVLDVGAGTGRVAIPLARGGMDVTALDVDPSLLSVLRERSEEDGLSVKTVCADARSWRAPSGFSLVIVPMQTIQLFGGSEGRRRFLSAASENLLSGGLVAVAVADMTPGDATVPASFPPDVVSVGESVYASRPVCVSRAGSTMVIERERVRTVGGSEAGRSSYLLEIDDVDASEVERDARTVGLERAGRLSIPADGPYLGAEVVLLGG